MSFWGRVNAELEMLFGHKEAPIEYPVFSPDGDPAPPPLITGGDDPHTIDQASLISIQTNRTTPFTAIDIDVGLAGGTRGDTGAGNTTSPNQFPALQSSLNRVAALVGIPNFSQAFGTYGATPGVTYEFQVNGNSLTCERLPSGLIRTLRVPLQGVNSGLIANDVYVQQQMSLALNGLFVQFESPTNDVFYLRPGQVLNCTFTRIYVTTFSSSMRWRLIAGNNATMVPGTDERTLRQSLHIWDGMGTLDNPMLQPVPFFNSWSMDGTILGGNKYTTIFENYDSGSGLAAQPGGNVVGQVSNKGYKVLWITGLTVYSVATGDSGVKLTSAVVSIYKALKGVNGATPDHSQASYPPFFVERCAPSVVNGGLLYNETPIQLAAPIRIVLAGWDTFIPANGVQGTGESLMMEVVYAQNASVTVSISGYMLGVSMPNPYANNPVGAASFTMGTPALIPNNPYPNDVILPL